ncbi:unnamed protein product [Prorocentrum cordatum]|uniref:Uncharacterized protein n=1 Tax=Prorocentrum cordatum TaxID=2364126 RepID=A0ABN9WBA7_9DINO|nr:unnamed protein product [Polarella glacialis]
MPPSTCCPPGIEAGPHPTAPPGPRRQRMQHHVVGFPRARGIVGRLHRELLGRHLQSSTSPPSPLEAWGPPQALGRRSAPSWAAPPRAAREHLALQVLGLPWATLARTPAPRLHRQTGGNGMLLPWRGSHGHALLHLGQPRLQLDVVAALLLRQPLFARELTLQRCHPPLLGCEVRLQLGDGLARPLALAGQPPELGTHRLVSTLLCYPLSPIRLDGIQQTLRDVSRPSASDRGTNCASSLAIFALRFQSEASSPSLSTSTVSGGFPGPDGSLSRRSDSRIFSSMASPAWVGVCGAFSSSSSAASWPLLVLCPLASSLVVWPSGPRAAPMTIRRRVVRGLVVSSGAGSMSRPSSAL